MLSLCMYGSSPARSGPIPSQCSEPSECAASQDHRWDDAKPSGLHFQRFSLLVEAGNAYNMDFPGVAPQKFSVQINEAFDDLEVRKKNLRAIANTQPSNIMSSCSRFELFEVKFVQQV